MPYLLRSQNDFFLPSPEQMKKALRRTIWEWEKRHQRRNLDLRRVHNLLSAGGGKKRKKKEGTDDKWFEFTPTRIEELAGEVASLQEEVQDLTESVRFLNESVRFEKEKARELFELMSKGFRSVLNIPGMGMLFLYLARRFSPETAKVVEGPVFQTASSLGLTSPGSSESFPRTATPPSPPRS